MTDSENRSVRLNMMFAPSEIEAIDDWGFANRIRSRSDAIRRLIKRGLEAEAKDAEQKN